MCKLENPIFKWFHCRQFIGSWCNYCLAFLNTLRSFIYNTFWKRCFWFFNILVYSYIQKWEEKENPTMAFGESQLASAADTAKICSDGLGRPNWLAGYLWWPLYDFNFFSIPNFGHMSRTLFQKIRSIFFKRY